MTAVYEKKVCASCGTSWTAPPDYCPSCEAMVMRVAMAATPDAAQDAIDAQSERLRKHAGPVVVDAFGVESVAMERTVESVFPESYISPLADYERATIALRDAELALKAAQEGYRRALEALNKAIAPFPSEATK